MQHDIPLDQALAQVTLHPDKVAQMPLLALDMEIRIRGAEMPGLYLVSVWSTGAEPFQTSETQELNALQFAALYGPLMRKNQAVLERRGRRLADAVEAYLKGVQS